MFNFNFKESKIVKISDQMSALLYTSSEVIMGNRFMQSVLKDVKEGLMSYIETDFRLEFLKEWINEEYQV